MKTAVPGYVPGSVVRPVLRSEITKIRTLRSTCLLAAALPLLGAGLGAVAGWSIRRAIDTHSPSVVQPFDPEAAGLSIVGYTQFVVIVFAVLTVTSEFTSGSIRPSLAAVPHRGRFYATKLAAGILVTLAVAVPSVTLGYLTTESGLGPHGTTLHAPGLPLAMAGAVGYLALTAVLCMGVATAAARGPALALSVLLPLYFLFSQLLTTVRFVGAFAAYLPDQAGFRMFAVGAHSAHGLTPGVGCAVLAAWAGVGAGLGHLRLRRLDASA